VIAILEEEAVDPGAAPARAVGLSLESGLRDQGEQAVVVAGAWTSGDEVADVLARTEEAHGPLRAVVLASAGDAATLEGDLVEIDPAQWHRRVELPLQRTLACFQGTHRRLRVSGGSLVVLVPTLALVGASGFVPWAVVAEGQRSLAKAAARAWGHDRITVNCVAVPGALLAPSGSPDRPGQPDAALARPPDLRHEMASVVASVVSDGWTGVTGATIAVDGGVWMTP